MRQSLRILQLPLLELKDFLDSQLEDNLVLEYEDIDFEGKPLKESLEKIMEANYQWQDPFLGQSPDDIEKKENYKQTLITKPPTLQEYLLRQIGLLSLDEIRLAIAESIIGNLDHNGYLNASLDELILLINKSKKFEEKAGKREAESVLKLIQKLDPSGVAARNLKESLLIQLTNKNNLNPVTEAIVKSFLSDLAKNKIKHIARKLKVSEKQVTIAKKEISSLEPKPGRAFSSQSAQTLGSSAIDVVVEKVNGSYQVFVNSKTVPRLRISPLYLKLLKSTKLTDEEKKYVQEKVRDGLALAKAISQRTETIQRIAEVIVNLQKDFFDHDDPNYLKPLTLKDIAKIVDKNESTISRAVNNKYIDTPQGIYKFDYFFSKALKTENGDISNESAKHAILNLVDEENPKKPLKDSQLVKLLKKEGIPIARRTVAKYREELKIPPYHARKKK